MEGTATDEGWTPPCLPMLTNELRAQLSKVQLLWQMVRHIQVTGRAEEVMLLWHTRGTVTASIRQQDGTVPVVATDDEFRLMARVVIDAGPEDSFDMHQVGDRIASLLQCMQPFACCRRGLLQLVPHAQLLQASAAALKVFVDRDMYCFVNKMAWNECPHWSDQVTTAAHAEHSKVQQEHAHTFGELCYLVLQLALRRAEHALASAAPVPKCTQQQKQQQFADVLQAVDRVAAAGLHVVELEGLLQLARG
jgi:hypothetical protein